MSVEVERATCPRCGEEIDPDWCWCGCSKESHDRVYSDHLFVPMGCVCHFERPKEEQA